MSESPETYVATDGSQGEGILARVTDACFALDSGWRLTFLNERAARLFERSGDDLIGELVWDECPGPIEGTLRTECERAMETQDAVVFEEYHPPLDSWFEVRAYPSRTGMTVFCNEVTERIQQKNALRDREDAMRRAYEVVAESNRPFLERVTALLQVCLLYTSDAADE